MKSLFLGLIIVLLPYADCSALSYSNHIVFSGHITGLGVGYGWEDEYGQIETGDQFSGFFYYSFSDNTQPSINSPGYVYDLTCVDFILSYGLFFNNFMITPSMYGPRGIILHDDPVLDRFSFVDIAPAISPRYLPNSIDDITIEFYDPSSQTINNSFNLPKSFKSFTSGRITVGPCLSPGLSIVGQIDKITTVDPVPEPTTMLLFGTGLAGLAAVGRKRRS